MPRAGSRKAGAKYIKRIKDGGRWRYFYTEDEIKAHKKKKEELKARKKKAKELQKQAAAKRKAAREKRRAAREEAAAKRKAAKEAAAAAKKAAEEKAKESSAAEDEKRMNDLVDHCRYFYAGGYDAEHGSEGHRSKQANKFLKERNLPSLHKTVNLCGFNANMFSKMRNFTLTRRGENEFEIAFEATLDSALHGDDRLPETGGGTVKCERTIKHRDGKILSCSNDYLEIKDAPKGTGADVFARQVQSLRDAGAKEIKCYAAHGRGFNGYYTWPRFGYQATSSDDRSIRRHLVSSLDLGTREKFGKQVQGPNDAAVGRLIGEDALKALVDDSPPPSAGECVARMMETKQGRDLWKQIGVGFEAKFDLETGSNSMKVLNKYLAEKNKAAVKAAKMGTKAPKSPDKAEEIELSEEDERILDKVWAEIREERLGTKDKTMKKAFRFPRFIRKG